VYHRQPQNGTTFIPFIAPFNLTHSKHPKTMSKLESSHSEELPTDPVLTEMEEADPQPEAALEPPLPELVVGDRVQLVADPPYFKTADPMPMLRPPNLVKVGEEGVVIDRRPGGYWGVRFSKGTFLLDRQYLAILSPASEE
jgi:hypothetical protein